MKSDLASLLRANPDVAALALVITLVVPQLNRQPNSFHLTLAARPSAERVWQRLENRMRVFEQRFDRVAPPRVRSAAVPGSDSE